MFNTLKILSLALTTLALGCHTQFDHDVHEHCDQVAQCAEDQGTQESIFNSCEQTWYHMEEAAHEEQCDVYFQRYFSCASQRDQCEDVDSVCARELSAYRSCMADLPNRSSDSDDSDDSDQPSKRDASLLLLILLLV